MQKYVAETNHIWDPFWLLGNPRAFNALPDDLKTIVRREFDRASVEQRADVARLNTSLKSQLSGKGLTFVPADRAAFRAALSKVRLLYAMARQVRRRSVERPRSGDGENIMSAAHNLEVPGPSFVRDAHGESGIERWLRRGIEVLAAAAVVGEVALLFVGIVARAVFHQPLIWSDELASILFLWLAMLGSALAVQRSCHMRLTFFVSHMSPRAQAWAETLAVAAAAAFLRAGDASRIRLCAGPGIRRNTGTRLVGLGQGTGDSVRLRGGIGQLRPASRAA